MRCRVPTHLENSNISCTWKPTKRVSSSSKREVQAIQAHIVANFGNRSNVASWPYKVVGPGVTAPMQSPLKPIVAADAIDVITFVVSLVD